MKPTATNSAPALNSVTPILAVRDFDEALAYYRDTLGFSVSWTWGDPPNIGAVARGAVEIQLVLAGSGGPPGPSCLYCQVSGVDAVYGEFRERGATILGEPADRPYGMRDFKLTDPSGNRIDFGQPC